MNQLTKAAPTIPGLLPDAEALALALSLDARIDGLNVTVTRMPTTVERQVMAARSEAIGKAIRPMAPSERPAAAAAIAGLLVGYGYARNDPRAAETIATYVAHLADMPLFAVVAACDDVRERRVYDTDPRTGNRKPLNPDKEPSTIRLGTIAQKHVDRLSAERYAFDKVLLAKKVLPAPPSQEEREHVAGKLKQLSEDLRAHSAEEDLKVRQRDAARADEKRKGGDRLIRDEYEALGLEPVEQGGLLVSLSMLLASGWTVAETKFGGDVRRELVRPGAAHD